MSEPGNRPSLAPGDQVLVSMDGQTNLVNYLPDTTTSAVVVAIRWTPAEVETALEGTGIDPFRVMVVPVGLDDPAYLGPLDVTRVVRPSDLANLGRQVSERLETADGEHNWLVIDDLIVLLMYSGDARVLRFLRTIASRVRINEFKAVYGIQRDTVSAETFKALSEICEHHLDLTAD